MKKILCCFILLLGWTLSAYALEIVATVDLQGKAEPCPG